MVDKMSEIVGYSLDEACKHNMQQCSWLSRKIRLHATARIGVSRPPHPLGLLNIQSPRLLTVKFKNQEDLATT